MDAARQRKRCVSGGLTRPPVVRARATVSAAMSISRPFSNTFSNVSSLASHAPLRILLIRLGDDDASITFAGLAQPLRLAAKLLGPQRLIVESMSPETAHQSSNTCGAQLVLLIGDDGAMPLRAAETESLQQHCRAAEIWGTVGSLASWASGESLGEVHLTSNLFELDGNRLSCCGGAASIDFALSLVEALYGAELQADIMEALYVEQVRGAARQLAAPADRFGVLQPKLAEALQLMEANIEEPLATDDIANLVGISRRQLERQFKQFLGNVPSRYYLELRLQRARQLLLDSHHSIVQVGLMCGFSSGSHFSTAYGALFGITPRDERQRKLSGWTVSK
jgi:transcriptional regulator GlxA family with amidase domain